MAFFGASEIQTQVTYLTIRVELFCSIHTNTNPTHFMNKM